MLSRFHDTRGEHGFDPHSSPGFQPDHSRSGWDYLLENWSHPHIHQGEQLFQDSEGRECLLEGELDHHPPRGYLALWGGDYWRGSREGGWEESDHLGWPRGERGRIEGILRLSFNPLSGRWPLYSLQTTLTDQRRSSPWGRSTRPSSSCRSPTASFFPSIHTSTHFILSENRRGQLKWLQGEENFFWVGWIFGFLSRATEKMNSSTLNYRGINDRAKETIVSFLSQIYSTNWHPCCRLFTNQVGSS